MTRHFIQNFRRFRSAIWIDDVLGWRKLGLCFSVFGWTAALFSLGWVVLRFVLPLFRTEAAASSVVPGLLLVVALASLVCLLVVGLVYSYFLFYRLETVGNSAADQPISYPAAELLLSIDEAGDVNGGVLVSDFMRRVFVRSGASPQGFFRRETAACLPEVVYEQCAKEGSLDLPAVSRAVYEASPELAEFLFSSGVTKETFVQAARWVSRTNIRLVRARRFWSPDRLRQIEPVGQTFTYGRAYTLEKLTRALSGRRVFLGASATSDAFADELGQIYHILTRPQGANALLVGERSGGVDDILADIAFSLRADTTPEPLIDYQMKVLDTQALMTATESKARFEQLLEKIIVEAITAGNVMLVIEDFPQFVQSGAQIGANVGGILEPALASAQLPIILTSDISGYHDTLEGTAVMSQLGAVQLKEVDDDALLNLLGEVAVGREGDSVCTVGALRAVIRSGRQVIADDQMPHAAVNLLLEIITANPDTYIDRDVIETYVSNKTGVPTGAISTQERNRLTGLEDKLAERVVGQKPALDAIAAALRRNRSGVAAGDKPIGSFLLFGPTGVGKTQTAKTLNEIYFDGRQMRRLDMSEYSGQQALDRLRGDGASGRLADIVREQPYGVLLLDEFEKASRGVHDLFLQIFDEGYFTDGAGRRVDLENLIIIATSNAGAQRIFKLAAGEGDVRSKHDELVRGLIDTGVFRPELLNRFDATILYEPLSISQLEEVTRILLAELAERVRERGVKVSFADELVERIAREGNNPEFGARAIKRVIQNMVENTLADKLISQEVAVGQTVTLSVDDVTIS